jgi:hypothetical protein
MAFMACIGNCIGCGAIFSFNPQRVPSVPVRYEAERLVPDPSGTRQPICQSCVARWNVIRKSKGIPEIITLPGAYEAEEIA